MNLSDEEVQANLSRAEDSLQAANTLYEDALYDFSASRSYYAAFYATQALLLSEGITRSKHSGNIAALHQYFVKTGKLPRECGTTIDDLFELRGTGDYGGAEHVTPQSAAQAIDQAEEFVRSIKAYLEEY
jgi:uncharacterized protein (UPF0332 family)